MVRLNNEPVGHKVVLSLCDYTGNWAKPYEDAGYDVQRIDLKRGGDVRFLEFLGNVHGILAAPPCTCFASSGARWKRSKEDMIDALSIVDACLRIVAVCSPEWWCLENPVGTLRNYIGPPVWRFDPCDYGEPYKKRTCLWGRFTPPLAICTSANEVFPSQGSKMHLKYGGKSERTKEARSATPHGFAQAFFEANP